jgi:hypothetical protein
MISRFFKKKPKPAPAAPKPAAPKKASPVPDAKKKAPPVKPKVEDPMGVPKEKPSPEKSSPPEKLSSGQKGSQKLLTAEGWKRMMMRRTGKK